MDYEIAFLLVAVLIVLIFAWYIQVHILPSLAPVRSKKSTGLFRARVIDDDSKENGLQIMKSRRKHLN